MRLEDFAESAGDRVEIDWRSFLLRVEPKTGDREKFIAYTQSWLRPAETEPRAAFQVWASDADQPSSSVPAQVAFKTVEAGWPELAMAYHRRLLEAYFSENRNIASSDELVNLAVEVGIDRDEFESFASEHTEEMTRNVIEDHNSAMEREVTAAPTVVFADAFAVPGAQPVETYERILEAIESRQA